ncbi:serine/threonine-protein kinase YPK1-like [Xenopus laevis]|uniref:Serine/threonine-protein kinase YPK1-like n=2 Tax=Xenopus laevis TaxID=8355 RepID=A0A8J1LZZ2_XENLA|nr:serine/threonine-protein kinase YPK1-like [Xenopus laevis]XP_041434778.1 serine/threonine-protein kinase YPK1-like [Xenopus laevis]
MNITFIWINFLTYCFLSASGMNFDTITNGECGTIFYKAPELFRGQYTRSVDWWALGVTIYELLTGIVPFNGTTTLEIYVIIKSEEPKYPEDITEDTLSILVNLLKKDAQLRLGTGEHGTEDVKKSPFFEVCYSGILHARFTYFCSYPL